MSAVIIDRLTNVGIAKESTRGTAATPTLWMPHQEVSVQDRVENVIDNSGIGRIESGFAADIMSQWAEGSVSGNIYSKSVGFLLYNALGAVSSADNADTDATVKDHTFTIGNTNSHQSLTLTVQDANEKLAYANAMLTSLEFTAELNQFVRYNASFLAKASATSSATAAYTDDARFRAQDVTVKMADATSGLGDATAIKLRSATITLNMNAEMDFALGSVDINDIHNKQFGVTVSLEALYRDNTWVELMRNGTQKAMSIAFVNTGVTIGDSANPSLTFTFEPGTFSPRELSGGLDDLKTETLEFTGLYSLANSKMLSAVLTNTQASY